MIKRILTGILSMACLTACQQEEVFFVQDPEVEARVVDTTRVIPGKVRVKLKPETADSLRVEEATGGGIMRTRVADLDSIAAYLRADRMERVIPPSLKFEARHRARGLHLWYDVTFDEQVSTRAAVAAYRSLPGVEHAEEIITPESSASGFSYPFIHAIPLGIVATRAGENPYNDPHAPNQWYLRNPGTSYANGAVAGADINAFEAWQYAGGSPGVVVAVIDKTAVQANHPDLAANMWVNAGEIPGNGIDDDQNGYVDDVHGFDYTDATRVGGRYVPGPHALHFHPTWCAGFVSAVNNNGVGICSVAGGTGAGDGVRLMTLSWDSQAFVYAADNGAVIASNSWYHPEITLATWKSLSEKEFVDYFLDYAGTDAGGHQAGAMSGGLVLFAAGNDEKESEIVPAAYERVVAVAAMGPDYKRAYYSTYGNWVDITAPGGNSRGKFGLTDKGMLFGTTLTSEGSYEWYEGTSGACPIVAGCAALILSKFQRRGFTADELKGRLLAAVQDIDVYNASVKGKMGVGYVDVGLALKEKAIVEADVPVPEIVASYDDWAIIEWAAAAAEGYVIAWSTSPFVGQEQVDVSTKTFEAGYFDGHEKARDTIRGLARHTRYYYAMRAVDSNGRLSGFSDEVTAVTVENKVPRLIPRWTGEVLWEAGATYTLLYDIDEPEGLPVAVTIDPPLSWITAGISENVLTLEVNTRANSPRLYAWTLTATDIYGASGHYPLEFRLYAAEDVPVVSRGIPDIALRVVTGKYEISPGDYFHIPAGTTLAYTVESDARHIADVEIMAGKLRITPKAVGSSYVTVTALNAEIPLLTTAATFLVQVTDKSYFSAVQSGNQVTILINEPAAGITKIRFYNAAGREVLTRQVEIPAAGYVIDLGSFSSGVYSVLLVHDSHEETKHVVKR
ncbi:MAG: S8 family serine peptidase [Odoribacteraceae bacterium]|jgi:hypothetical protein|nr:S8 family serine peptidase [Odoribacteraceae bacterium]